jgi:glycine cleavage system H lipoate-binding protein
LRAACGGYANGGYGKEDLNKVKKILSQHPSLLNEDLEGDGWTSLRIASYNNSDSVVEYLLSCDEMEVNKQDKV